MLVKLLSENWSRPHDERKIPTRTATRSTTKMATKSHQPHYRVDTNRTKSSPGTAAIHRRHPGGPSLPDSGAAVTRGSHDGSRLEPPYSGPPHAQWPPLAGGPSPHEPPPSGCPQDRWPRHPASGMSMPIGENQQNRGRSYAIMAFMTVLTA